MKCIWFGSGLGNPSNSATSYNSVVCGLGSGYASTENDRKSIISEGITVTKLTVKVFTAPGSGKNWAVTFRDDAADTAATVTIADAATSASWSGSVSVASLSLINMKIVPTGTPTAAVRMYWEIEYETAGDYFLITGTGSPVPDSGTAYHNVYAGNTNSSLSTALEPESLVPSDATVTRMVAKNVNNSPAGSVHLYLRLNDTTDAIDCWINAGVNPDDEVASVDIAPGDRWVMKITTAGSPPANSYYTWGLTVQPDTVGECFFGFGNTSIPSAASADYDWPIGYGQTWSSEANRKSPLPNLDFKKLYVKLVTAPGSGKSRVFALRDNASDTALSVTIADANTTGNNTANTVTHSGVDGNIKTTPSGTPASTAGVKMGFVVVVPQGGGAAPFVPRAMIY